MMRPPSPMTVAAARTAAEALHDGLDQSVHLSGVALVCLEGHGANAFAFELADDRFRLVDRRRVADSDVRAVFRQGPRRRRADAARSAGDQRDLPCESLRHAMILLRPVLYRPVLCFS